MNGQLFSVNNVSLNEPNSQINNFAVGDFDQDGVLDLVSVQVGFTPGSLTRFHRGLGDGTFAAPVTVASFNGNEWVEAWQFNPASDDFLDIVVGSSSAAVRIYPGDGAGSFGAPTTILVHPDALFMGGLAVGDLDGDPYPDLVSVVHDCDGGASAYSLLGSASGAFTVVRTGLSAGSCFPLYSFTIAQLLASADPDVVGPCWDASGQKLGFLVGDGAGGFSLAEPFSLATIANRTGGILGVADFDENGTLDVIFNDQYPVGGPTNWTRTWMDVLLGDGNGGYDFHTRYWTPEPGGQGGIAVADLNRDGHLDIVTSGAWLDRSPGAKVNLVFGDGYGGFSEVTSIWGLAESPETMFVVDFDGDGRPDVLLSTSETSHEGPAYQGNYSVLLNRIESTD
jgi:hypothetical protein